MTKDINNITDEDKEYLTYQYLLVLGLVSEGDCINNLEDFDACIDEHIYNICKTKTDLNPYWIVRSLTRLGYDLKALEIID